MRPPLRAFALLALAGCAPRPADSALPQGAPAATVGTVTPAPPPGPAPAAAAAPAPTPEQAEPDSAVAARLAELTEGYTAAGAPVHGKLERIPTISFPARRERCYLAVVVLEAGARPDSDRGPGLRLELTAARESRGSSGGAVAGSRRLLQAGGELCPQSDGNLTLVVTGRDEHSHSAGSGPFRAIVYEKFISDAELRERDAEEDRDYCLTCMKQRLRCQDSGDTGEFTTCAAQFRDCMTASDLTSAECEP
ncbi:MAG: hypothetical protein IT370_34495 [Deltaproteobacteria bacterium]|nr:hypothetical protein [Deltaproteobacteria bacterium]